MSATGETLWRDTIKVLENKLDKVAIQSWFSTTKVNSFDGINLVIQVQSPLALNFIKKNFQELIDKTIRTFTPEPIATSFIILEDTHPNKTTQHIDGYSDFPYQTPFNPRYTFETFVIGDRNRFAHAASVAVAERPAYQYNPFFVYGGVGLGKTHLMHAIGQRALEINPAARVVYITSETFVREFVTALQTHRVDEFRNKYRTVDILLIDDIQFISGKESTQEEFFHTFNSLHAERKQIVITSDRQPKDIPDLEDRLRSRFSGGLLTDIKPPEFETRVAILRRKARGEGLEIPEEALYFIASKIETNVRELEGALIRVIAYSSMMNQDIDEQLAEEALVDIVPAMAAKRPLTILDIQKVVCSHYHIKLEDMKGRSRQRDIAFPRQVAMWLSRELTGLSLPKIGNEFGGRDHTTVIHAYDKISRDAQNDQHLHQIIKHLEETLSTSTP